VNGEGVNPEEMSGFTYLEHPDNVGLALKVCEHLGVDRNTALKGMHQAYPDVGAMKIFRLDFGFRKVYFINALAANDPQSTYEIWRRVEQMFPEREHLTVMLNTRADRFDRSIQLLEMLKSVPVDKIALVGQKQDQVNMNAMRLKFPKDKIVPIKTKELHNIYDQLLETCSQKGLSIIFGIGNMGQGGLQIADYFRHKYISMRDKMQLQ
jgi:poly-gamma-glutamate synthase PgsB/CapB